MFWSLFFQTLIFIVVIVAAGQLIAKLVSSKKTGRVVMNTTLIWQAGVVLVMLAFGLIALIGYLKQK